MTGQDKNDYVLTVRELRALLALAAHMHAEDLLADGTSDDVRAVCEKAHRLKDEGYVAIGAKR